MATKQPAQHAALAALVAALLAGLATAQPGAFACPPTEVRRRARACRRRRRRRRRRRQAPLPLSRPPSTGRPAVPTRGHAPTPRPPHPARQVAVPAGADLTRALLAPGFTYRLPAGNYTLTESIQGPGGAVCIRGAGSGSDAATGTVVRFTAAVRDTFSFYIGSGSVGLFNLSITLHPLSARKDLGTVHVNSGGALRAEGVAFRGIGGITGGAVYAITADAFVNLTDALFEGSFAGSTGEGGAMLIKGGASADLYGATTIVRTLAYRGGAIRVDNGNVRFHGPVTATNATVWIANRWAGRGGGGGGVRRGRREMAAGNHTFEAWGAKVGACALAPR
jgi:hypothetical protein